jgi:hypothetical protein
MKFENLMKRIEPKQRVEPTGTSFVAIGERHCAGGSRASH